MNIVIAFLEIKLSIKYVIILLFGFYLAVATIEPDSKTHETEDIRLDLCLTANAHQQTNTDVSHSTTVQPVTVDNPVRSPLFSSPYTSYQSPRLHKIEQETSQVSITALESALAVKDFELYLQLLQSQKESRTNAFELFADEPVDHDWAQSQEYEYSELLNQDVLSSYPFEEVQCRSNQCAIKVFVQSDDEIRTLSKDLNSVLDQQSKGQGALPVMIERDPNTEQLTVYIARTMQGFNLSGQGAGNIK
ncbi:hypothetical protein [Pseudoalteromonas luteoviolacea]|uniref:Uncharacterized protein n=1 Tax=Pseudoalteromonas luteoviolacea S4054 TaxID=1129367 RepID=A0A0F6AG07_9GAMM|nr:hypothetical protein [Pseudoalteromonas luteoviolacea]AOT09148.1 hypothetical protein S4054249_15420 [Pseudoalteromonas luteoviolacea]AOT14061.1 hypothetical protein S40542_15390 [Pseudoalteromonas luteoviolacea]AOT18976.1 hypothetical protein S4054_15395 [Pseudoalteromonas luteoviolacea]KKE85152.1 hypothetical protein N479_06860 [Pseudoalteromonas luteoviolacea S4054]KZN70270.1 hypothetical protein N481_01970 [Pseudoalteromonas luteoviolacea S4047-1]